MICCIGPGIQGSSSGDVWRAFTSTSTSAVEQLFYDSSNSHLLAAVNAAPNALALGKLGADEQRRIAQESFVQSLDPTARGTLAAILEHDKCWVPWVKELVKQRTGS